VNNPLLQKTETETPIYRTKSGAKQENKQIKTKRLFYPSSFPLKLRHVYQLEIDTMITKMSRR
jgi:hypothetical protein